MFESFQNFIPKAAKNYSIDKELHASYVCHLFKKDIKEIFKNKKDISSYIKPVHFKNGVLLISAQNAGWAQEVTFKKDGIKHEINKNIKPPLKKITEIKIKIIE